MDAETALTIAGGIAAVMMFGLFFANICGMINCERPSDHPRPTAVDCGARGRKLLAYSTRMIDIECAHIQVYPIRVVVQA